MSDKPKVVSIFSTHTEAEAALLTLQTAGVDLHKLSIVGQDYQLLERARGLLTWKDTATTRAKTVGFYGALFSFLAGGGLLLIPGVGSVYGAGHASIVAATLIKRVTVSGIICAVLGGLVGAVDGRNHPQEQALKYKMAMEPSKFAVYLAGTDEEIEQAQQLLQPTGEKVAS